MPFCDDNDIGVRQRFDILAGVSDALEGLAQRAVAHARHVQHLCQRFGIVRAYAADGDVVE